MNRMKTILFSTEMVNAILDGRKTQTRRVIKINGYPLCQPGDILWVRETWAEVSSGIIEYKATYKEPYTGSAEIDHIGNKIKWRPSIHMPREAARIFLLIKNVELEKLQDISEEAAQAEGVLLNYGASDERICRFQSYRDAFKALWDDLNKKRGYGWNMNPWVWAYEFEDISREVATK